jgi:UDP-N-acetylglucosamine 2-epimerase (non-hydrolysing)
MSAVFFEELGIEEPDHMLAVGPGSHAQQTARVMERLEPILLEERPDLVLVPGDVNSTLAAALVAAKLGIPVGHIEAGLRSFDLSMPEEINRIVADRLSEFMFIHSPEAEDNLLAEGRPGEAIHYVGNTMIDTLVAMRERIEALDTASRHDLPAGEYLVVTLHRPALVDGPMLVDAVNALERIAEEISVVFPAHPRTRKAMDALGVGANTERFQVLDPLSYIDFLGLLSGAAGVLTDSGGIQEEATYLAVPCFTLRDNTERPVTVALGTNTLLGLRPERIMELPHLIAAAGKAERTVPPKWDGKAAGRLVQVLLATGAGVPARTSG